MNKQLLKLTCAIIFAFVSYAASAQNKMANFSGKWILNEEKCDFGRLTAASASKVKSINISQTKETITVTSGDTLNNSTILFNLDGKPSQKTVVTVINDIPNTSKMDINLQIVSNKSFIATITDPVNMPSSSIKTYTLSDDGQLLTIAYKNYYGQQLLDGMLVYDKKKD